MTVVNRAELRDQIAVIFTAAGIALPDDLVAAATLSGEQQEAELLHDLGLFSGGGPAKPDVNFPVPSMLPEDNLILDEDR